MSLAWSDGSYVLCRDSVLGFKLLVRNICTPCPAKATLLIPSVGRLGYWSQRKHQLDKIFPNLFCGCTSVNALFVRDSSYIFGPHDIRGYARDATNASVQLKTDEDIVRFNIGDQNRDGRSSKKEKKIANKSDISKKKKLNELRFYRLKAKKKMNSPNPEVRIRYKLEKVSKQVS